MQIIERCCGSIQMRLFGRGTTPVWMLFLSVWGAVCTATDAKTQFWRGWVCVCCCKIESLHSPSSPGTCWIAQKLTVVFRNEIGMSNEKHPLLVLWKGMFMFSHASWLDWTSCCLVRYAVWMMKRILLLFLFFYLEYIFMVLPYTLKVFQIVHFLLYYILFVLI